MLIPPRSPPEEFLGSMEEVTWFPCSVRTTSSDAARYEGHEGEICVCVCVCLKCVTQWTVYDGNVEDSGRPCFPAPAPPGWCCWWRCGWGGAPKLTCSPPDTSDLQTRERRERNGHRTIAHITPISRHHAEFWMFYQKVEKKSANENKKKKHWKLYLNI